MTVNAYGLWLGVACEASCFVCILFGITCGYLRGCGFSLIVVFCLIVWCVVCVVVVCVVVVVGVLRLCVGCDIGFVRLLGACGWYFGMIGLRALGYCVLIGIMVFRLL